jgi:PAS domain S-box-containing protein
MAEDIQVLCVDDEAELLEIGKLLLERGGELSVDTALSAPAALAILKKKAYDAIVADYYMPDMDGIEFLKNVRAAEKTIPFILFTGRGREEVAIEALNNGANFYLQKGGEPKIVYRELDHVIRQSVLMRRTQLTLAEKEQRYQDLQNTSDLIMSVDPEGHFLFVNKTWRDTLGYREDEIVNLTLSDVIHEDGLHSMELFQRVIVGEIVGIFEVVFRARNGTKVYAEGIANGRLAGGTSQYARAIFKDVTERKLAEEALRQANKKLNLLSSITRHDINNQILTVNGFITLLRDKHPDLAQDEYFSRISQVIRRISAMIRFTKDYDQIGVHAPVWQDLRIIVDEAMKSATPGNVILKNDLPAGSEIFADPLITKVFFNLIDNAMRHGGRIATIRFSLESRNGDSIIVCEDDGDGIAGEIKGQIFERGFGKNTGYGLFISREILDITSLTIKETGIQGAGARFEIAVPKGQYRSRGGDRKSSEETLS